MLLVDQAYSTPRPGQITVNQRFIKGRPMSFTEHRGHPPVPSEDLVSYALRLAPKALASGSVKARLAPGTAPQRPPRPNVNPGSK